MLHFKLHLNLVITKILCTCNNHCCTAALLIAGPAEADAEARQ
ncbi:hypothetical protein T06_9076 [Trichinella sp. T6]|nr:hypothetical protein T06_9076 [Trichinella sp. T6]